jgi:hypothetical protein
MHAMIWRGLQTAFLAGGFLAAGAGIASAAENDVTVDVVGLTATVPVEDGAVLNTPVVTGTGEQLRLTADDSDPAGGLTLPVDTNDDGNTTLLGESPATGNGIGGISVPVTVTEADGSPPDPQDGLTVTVPVNTSDRNEDAGTTVVVPVVTGNIADVLDQDPTTGNDIDVNLEDLLVLSDDDGAGRNLLVDVEDLVTIGGNGGAMTPDTVLSLPVSADGDADTTVSLPVRSDGTGAGDPVDGGTLLAGNDIDVNLGHLITDGSGGSGDGATVPSDPFLSLPVNTGDLGGNGDIAADNTVDVNLAELLLVGESTGSDGTGSVITVPINEGAAGTGGNNLIAVTLPVALPGGAGDDDVPGTDDDAGNGTDDSDTSTGADSGTDADAGDTGTSTSGTGTSADPSTPADGSSFVAPARFRSDAQSRRTGDVGTGTSNGADTLAYTGADPLLPALAGLLALTAGFLLTSATRRRRVVLQ